MVELIIEFKRSAFSFESSISHLIGSQIDICNNFWKKTFCNFWKTALKLLLRDFQCKVSIVDGRNVGLKQTNWTFEWFLSIDAYKLNKDFRRKTLNLYLKSNITEYTIWQSNLNNLRSNARVEVEGKKKSRLTEILLINPWVVVNFYPVLFKFPLRIPMSKMITGFLVRCHGAP